MSSAHRVRIVQTEIFTEPVPFRTPLKFGGRVVDKSQLINARVTIENRQGRRAIGCGSMPVGNVWSWPTQVLSGDETEAAMIAFAQKVAETTGALQAGHPLQLGMTILKSLDDVETRVRKAETLAEPIPKLAQLVAASSIDAAIHDAYGRLHGTNSYRTLSKEYIEDDLSHFISDEFRGEWLDQYLEKSPKAKMPLYHLVGALDPLTDGDLQTRLDDDLPETLEEWIVADGLTHLKIKLSGEDPQWDIERVLAVDAVTAPIQQQRGLETWHYSCDFNEKCSSPDVVVDFLKTIRERNPSAYDRIQYLEQPLPRDLRAPSSQSVAEAAALKPVVIDESLVDYDTYQLARELGYSGIALKACKGHTESLLLAAAAQKHKLFLCVQDLTCPGQSFLHSASLAAWIPTVAAIEGNARQYCPAPNDVWQPHYPGMFEIDTGVVATSELDSEGLGFSRNF